MTIGFIYTTMASK